MSELSPASRELLAAAREQLGPDPAAVARMRQAISATVGGAVVGASTGSVAAVGTASATTTAAGSGALVTKLGIVSVLAVVAIGTAVWAVRDDDKPRARTAPVVEVARTVEQASSPPPPAPAAIETPAPAVESVAPAMAPASTSVRTAKPARPSTAHAAPAATADLAREVELIDQAMVSLRNGQPREALVALRKHASETRGHGQLAEDAAAIEVEALCRLHDRSVGAKLAAFDQRFPTSAQRSRLSTQCK